MPLRKLVLKKESLAELTTGELRAVVGADDITPRCPTNPFCETLDDIRCYYSRLVDPCLPTEACTANC